MITVPRFFDVHVHLRKGTMMMAVLAHILRYCQAIVWMPNDGPVKTAAEAKLRRDEVKGAATALGYPNFKPYGTVMITDETDWHDVANWRKAGVVAGKYYPGDLYPYGGVHDLKKIRDVLWAMADCDIPIPGHFERAGVHPLQAEEEALPDFRYLADHMSGVRVVFEHITTAKAVEAVLQYDSPHVVATVTPQGLRLTADDVFSPDRKRILKPHNWYRSCAKSPEDRDALIEFTSCAQALHGGDFAVHPEKDKRGDTPETLKAGCACYPAGPAVIAEVFSRDNRLDCLPDFTSGRAANFYSIELDPNTPPLTIIEEEWHVPDAIPFGSDGERIIPWLAGERLPWKVF